MAQTAHRCGSINPTVDLNLSDIYPSTPALENTASALFSAQQPGNNHPFLTVPGTPSWWLNFVQLSQIPWSVNVGFWPAQHNCLTNNGYPTSQTAYGRIVVTDEFIVDR